MAKNPNAVAQEKPKVEDNWHALSAQQILDQLATPPDLGLTADEAARRLQVYGPNQLTEAEGVTFWQMLWQQFKDFIVMLLIVAALISMALGEWVDAGAIIAIVVLNATLGVIQERRAEQALAALKKLAAPEAQVLRDGSRQNIPANQLVPGDIVLMEAGNFIPADVRLLEAVNLQVEEAALTGESVPVQKDANIRLEADIPLGDRRNTAFMGTVVSYGRGRGVVVGTGMRTQIGLIAEMLASVEQEQTPLQRRLEELGKLLGWAALAVCGIVFLVAVFRNTDLGVIFTAGQGLGAYFREFSHELVEVFMVAVSLAIAAVPEGLPAVVTISLALGMREMIKRHALIRRLSSVETLGSATVICSDKTGTLTQNEMTVTRVWADGKFLSITGKGRTLAGDFLDGKDPVNLQDYQAILTTLWIGALNNDAEMEVSGEVSGEHSYRLVGDPTEGALIVAAAKAGALPRPLNRSYPRVQEVPFDATRKRMITIHDIKDARPEDISPFDENPRSSGYVITMKGAPDMVLELCSYYQGMDDKPRPLTDAKRQEILAANDAMTEDALRVLGVAFKTHERMPDASDVQGLEKDLIFVGLAGMIDPARPEVSPALKVAARAGIRTIMITGDYPKTAKAIAETIGLMRPGHKVLTGTDLNAMTQEQLAREVAVTDVFARVSPEHKLRIVEALRADGEVVAMTGDGVNDAPSIKRADIGVAMGITGTDVAKESAAMVLTDDNYASIVSAVEQGRIIYDNIRKFVFFLLSSNVAEIMIIFLATLAGLPTPLTAIQLLWLNLITDGAPALALAMEKGDPTVMQRQPRPPKEQIINGSMRLGIFIQMFAQTGATLGAFVLGLLWHLEEGAAVPAGMNPLLYLIQHDWSGVDVQTAETMAFLTLSMCELFRAYTVRSEYSSIFRIGVFSNKYMQYAVGMSLLLMSLVVTVPFLQPIFNTHMPNTRELTVIFGLAIIPAITEEITKLYLRRRQNLK
ncbi:MAG: cation-translocating P-type ATPase [Anaerolineales bacterium]|jgi:Ca2+-transporting ATPase|nr:cation-translocating P-type ATPase [Anaerolineales bacterium]